MASIILKLQRIVLGWYYVAIRFDPDYAKERRKVCRKCEKNKLGVCTMCGCPIASKPRIKEEECELGKW